MGILYCDGKRFKRAFIAGTSWLSENKEVLNRLNVFPVPDGDTGTNMSLTLLAAAEKLGSIKNGNLKEIVDTTARATLMGARGCSGVIFSQLVAGFAEIIQDKERLTAKDIAAGLQAGVSRAYRAVTKPVEGTILTVIRESADEAVKFAAETDDIIKLLEFVLDRAKISLDNTPKLLPVLAQAGVVDSGGQGFVFMLEGMLRIVYGESIGIYSQASGSIKEGTAQERVSQKWNNPYCTEFLLMNSRAEVTDIKASLETLGEDLVVVEWDELIRVHIHTKDPEQVLALAHSYGKPTNLKIDDTRKQHQHIIHTPFKASEQDVSIITTAPGVGLKAILMNIGAEYVVMSEKARNPSVSELSRAIDNAFKDKVILLPNESNIIPASIQAANMSQKDVKIIPSRNISQGIGALLAFRPRSDVSKNLEDMEMAMKSVKHGEIARAIRDARYKNLVIKENDIIGLYDKEVKVTEDHIDKAVINLLKIMLEDNNEVITIFYGVEIEKDDAEKTLLEIETNFPDKEIELHYGGQSHCLYIVSVE